MSDKATKEITLREHVQAITLAIPDSHMISFEVRVYWNKKMQEYVIATPYPYGAESTLLRFTVRKPKGTV